MNPLAHFTKAFGLFLAQRASYLSPAVYRRTETAVYALGLQLSSLVLQQKSLA
ncbi:MAG: hypothetical protein GY943_17415 [Chloroflexi bacterium]|nr:hypothetical protein [Chloroflexota bacterium]